MRKFVLAAIAAGSALTVAVPASAQYYPQSVPYGYGSGYGGGWGQVRGLQYRIRNVLGSLNEIRPDQRYRLRAEAIDLDRQLRFAARNGLNPYEAQNFNMRIARLERQTRWAMSNGYYGYNRYGDDNGQYRDRDHRGREGWDGGDDDDGD